VTKIQTKKQKKCPVKNTLFGGTQGLGSTVTTSDAVYRQRRTSTTVIHIGLNSVLLFDVYNFCFFRSRTPYTEVCDCATRQHL